MATITRRTWANLRDEALKRIGREGDSAASTRMEYRITDAYLALALTYHHFELDGLVSNQDVASGALSTALPSDCYIVTGVRLLDEVGAHLQRLELEAQQFAFGTASSTAERPSSYVRWGSSLYFPAPTDDDYEVDIAYYKVPTLPDFSSGSPDTHWLWDQAILGMAVAGGSVDHWASEVAAPHVETLNAFLERVVAPPLKMGSLRDVVDAMTVDRPHGGAGG